ncbi:MAG: uracil-DNA glycosylase family protein, partial [Flavobacteriaceae bacterium]
MNVQKMWLHQHPFEPFLPKEATHLIVGTLPPPRFSYGNLKPGDVPFCYGSIDGQLWPILDRMYSLDLRFENSAAAVEERKAFLNQTKLGICDIVAHCYREKLDASDMGMQKVQL